MAELSISPRKRDRTNENVAKAIKGLMRRGDKISSRFNADVYIVVRRNNRHWDYNSSSSSLFPPTLVGIVCDLLIDLPNAW
jgi:hypothetical protein